MAALPLAASTACTLRSGRDHAGPEAPRQTPLDRPVRTAWVFSSGGPRGVVHVGVVKALGELGLQPDLIVGASAGAVVAVMYAAGMSAQHKGAASVARDIERRVMGMHPWMLLRLAVGAQEWLSGAGVAQWMRECTGGRPLQALRIPVACVARRVGMEEVVAFTRGDAGVAVQAAAAIEGEFTPVRIRGEWYADADLVQPLPVRMAHALGAQRVLAVDASAYEDRAPAGTEPWRAGDQRKRALTVPDARLADLLLHPDSGYYAGMSQAYRARTIGIGYRATLAEADALRKLHA